MKPRAVQLARAAVQAVGVGYTYDELDCQAFIEHCARQAGGAMDYLGTNDMARRAAWLGTLSQAQAEGRLVPGAGLLIREETEENLPARYASGGLGDFSHAGLYVGPDALTDTDKTGRMRSCDAVHSSATRGRVAGSTLQNGWTHVLWFPEIDYGASGGAGNAATGDGLTAGASPVRFATVVSPDGNPVKLRKSASREETLYWLVGAGARVEVERTRDGWSLIRALCTDGRTRRAWMMDRYLRR